MSLFNTKHLHALVYVVADKAAKDNVSPDVPLVGTASYKTLLCWLADMNVDVTRVRLYNQSSDPFSNSLSRMSLNKAIELDQIRVVALGQKAASYLDRVGINSYYTLPHPSGRNRQLNRPQFLKDKLTQCKEFIYGYPKLEKGHSQDLREEQNS